MPRRNHREQLAEAKRVNDEFLGDDYRFTSDPAVAQHRARNRRIRAQQETERWAQSVADWTHCIVPGCECNVPPRIVDGIEFPICSLHAAAVWRHVDARRTDNTGVESERARHAEAMAG